VSVAQRVPPQNIEAEESTLGAMLVNEPALIRIIEDVRLNAEDFYLDRHRAIFETISDLHAADKPVDELSVSEALSRSGRIEEAGGKHYVSELAAKVRAPGNASHHAEIVQQNAGLRRAIGDAQRVIEAAHNGTLNGEAASLAERLTASAVRHGEIATVKGSDVRLRVPRFLDSAEMLPNRSITVAFGSAGLGKTIYGIGQSAAVTKGRMSGLPAPAPVLVSSQEDDPEAVLAPRFVAAGADLDLVHFVSGLSLPSQVPALAARAKTLGAAMVLIDPIAAHLDPSIDSHRDAAIRAALSPVADMAQDLDLAVLVVCHPNKATGATGLNRISGSGAFGNAARSVIVFGLDPGDPDGETGNRRIIAHLKCNVGKRAPSISAEIETTKVETEDGAASVPRLRITGLSEHSADDVLSSPTGEERTERDEARAFLTEMLQDGPVRTKEIKAAAREAEIGWRTVERAKQDLALKAVQGGDGWYWLPEGRTEL
jgi:putative DNA primase/helicase